MGTPLWVARADTTQRLGMVLLPLWRHCLGILWHFASNAMTLVVCAVVLPVGLLFMLRQLFPQRNQATIVASGAIVAVAFCAFPWGFVVRGQLLPNLLSFVLIPGATGLCITVAAVFGVGFAPRLVLFVCCLRC